MAGLLHPLSHHLLHFIVGEVLFALKYVSKCVLVRFFLLFLLNLPFFMKKITLHLFLLPLISHISVNAAELSFLLCVLYNLVSFHGISTVVELQKELEEFAVAVLGVLRLGKRVDHVTGDFPDGRIVAVRRIGGSCLCL